VTILATIKDWHRCQTGQPAVMVTIDGDTLQLRKTTPAERAELVQMFTNRHQRS
jgi:hypothetical protein